VANDDKPTAAAQKSPECPDDERISRRVKAAKEDQQSDEKLRRKVVVGNDDHEPKLQD